MKRIGVTGTKFSKSAHWLCEEENFEDDFSSREFLSLIISNKNPSSHASASSM